MLIFFSIYLLVKFGVIFLAVCSPPCENGGTCIAPDTCSCRTGSYGQVCEKREFIYKIHSILDVIMKKSKVFGGQLSKIINK